MMKQVLSLLLVVLLVGLVVGHPVVTLDGRLPVIIDTNGSTLADHECRGQVIVNTGATVAQTHNLPSVAAGMHVTFSLSAAQDVDINPQNDDRILGLTDGNGDKISSDAVIRSTVELIGIDSTNWLPIRTVGTWADMN